MDTRPLILTLRFDDKTFAKLDALRSSHFPAALNHLPAHLTLFHHLPGGDILRAHDIVADAVRRPTFPMHVMRLRSLGRGVAFDVEAPELMQIRAAIARAFAADLTAQDRQSFQPHVTIQNKVTPAQARALRDHLHVVFAPWQGHAEGLLLWRYLGPAWALELDARFGSERGIADSRDVR